MKNYSWNELETPDWEPVSFAASCVYEDTLYFSGGWNPLTNSFNSQFWKMNEHNKWENMEQADIWSPRNGHSFTKFNGELWLIGGFNYESRYLGDIWKFNPQDSSDKWICISQTNPWEGREGHSTISYQNSLWIFGGITSSGVKNDIWTSKDGISWEGSFETPPWSSRCFHNVIKYMDKLWLIAGSAQEGALNDMYKSTNGYEWELVDDNLPFSKRFGAGCCVFDNKLWIVGGSDSKEREFTNDVWVFTEENGWSEVKIVSPWTPRWSFNTLQNYTNFLVLLCGGVRFTDRKYSAYSDGWVLTKIP